MQRNQRILWCAIGLLCLSGPGPIRADEVASPSGILVLQNGDSVLGDFRPSQREGEIFWQGISFEQPFEFVPGAVRSVTFPLSRHPERNAEFLVELVSGDRMTGEILNWSAKALTLKTPWLGVVQLRAEALRSVYRIRGDSQVVFSGPNGLEGWSGDLEKWQEEGLWLNTSAAKAQLHRQVNLPDQAVIDVQLAWERKPNFSFRIGMAENVSDDPATSGWQLEVWDQKAHLLRESAETADIWPLSGVGESDRRISLTIYLDQIAGDLHAYRPDGTLAGRLHLPIEPGKDGKIPPPGRSVGIENHVGDVRLERLHIAKWNGRLPESSPGETPVFELNDGTTVEGVIAQGNEDGKITLDVNGELRQLSVSDVVAVQFARAPEQKQVSETRITLHDGTQVSGRVLAIDEMSLRVSSPNYVEEVRVPRARLRQLVFASGSHESKPPSGRTGRLQIGDSTLSGRLVSGRATDVSSCLIWHPDGSRTASSLVMGTRGRIIYREQPKPNPEISDTPALQGQPLAIFANGAPVRESVNTRNENVPESGPETDQQKIYLRTGDLIVGKVRHIDDSGVWISAPSIEAEVIPHEQLKAIELVAQRYPVDLEAAKKDRLLTLPRRLKDSPPTHLLRSRRGDFLRCRLLAMQQKTLTVEVQLEEFELPRNRIAQIIWLHPEELNSTELQGGESGKPSDSDEKTLQPDENIQNQVQLIGATEGERVTFLPTEVNGDTIFGTSKLLGNCQFNLNDFDELVIGEQIETEIEHLPYQQWRLRPAVEPLVAQDLGSEGNPGGSGSPLVGQPAPEIDLEMLGGGRFQLSERRGEIVVLDFWASWCGPCMQSMPLLHEMIQEFKSEPVQLFSVNLEESAEQVKSVLDRHQLQLNVPMDRDGVAAHRYQVQAIPQVVVVDRQGVVAEVYVGGGPQMVERLRGKLQELLQQN